MGKASDLRAAANEPDWLFHLMSVPLGLYEGAEDVVDMVSELLHPIRLANDIDDMSRKITREIVFNDGQNIIRSRDMIAESLMNEPLRLPSRLVGNWLVSVAALETASVAMSKVPALYNAMATATMSAADRVLLKSFTDQLRRLKELPDAKQVVGFLKAESGMVLLDQEMRQLSQIIRSQTGTSMSSGQFDQLVKHLADPGDVLQVMSADDELLQLLKTYGVDATQLNANELKIIQNIALKYEVRTPTITTTTVGGSSGINLTNGVVSVPPMVGPPAPTLGVTLRGTDLVIDSQAAIALLKRAAHPSKAIEELVASGVLQSGEGALIMRLESLGRNPVVSEITAGEIAGENAYPQIIRSVDINSPEYQALIKELEIANVGGAKGVADRQIVADTFFAQTTPGSQPVFATMDRSVINRLYSFTGNDPAKLGKPVSEAFPAGFDVTITGKTITVIPLPNK